MVDKKTAIAVDVGGTKIAAGIVDIDGHLQSLSRADTPIASSDEVVAAIERIIETLFNSSGGVVGIGLSVAGTIDFKNGMIVESPNLPFSNLRLREKIESEFGLPTLLDNDGNLATFGEKHYGAARSAQNVIGLTLGTGIGAGIIINGCLYRGATGSAAEIGHMVIQATGPRCTCGSYGCFEEMAAGRTLVKLAKEKVERDRESQILQLAEGEIEKITGPIVTEAARAGDKIANEVFNEIGFWLGIGINNILNIFNPEVVVIGGGMAEAGDLLLNRAREVVFDRTLHPNQDVAEIILASLGNNAGIFGAAALVFDEVAI